MKTKKYIGIMMMAAGLLTATSCSDFDDYNKVGSDVTTSANQTLWENLNSSSELSDFAALVKKAGYDDELNAASFYTVWAPLNGTYDAASLMAEDSATVLTQFVKQHIALYSYPASGSIDESILSLNDKKHNFVGSGAYTFQNVDLAQTNLPSSNGLIHTLNGNAPFMINLYEYLSKGTGIDSLSAYFMNYEHSYLDTENSIVGPMVDGKQTYIDSVMVVYNSMANTLNARLENEDSTYNFLMPNNEAWNASYDKIKSCYKYATTTNYKTYTATSSSSYMRAAEASAKVTVDANFLTDSLSKRGIVDNLIFSNNNTYNKWVEDASALNTDTIYTTSRNKLSNPQELLSHTIDKVEMSNGFARIVDSVAYKPWESYAPILNIDAYRNRVYCASGSDSRVTVTYPDPAYGDFTETGLSYLWIQPTSERAVPKLKIKLPNVLSTTYNMYMVVVPASANLEDKTTKVLPNDFTATLNYANASGTWTSKSLGTFINDTSKVDTSKVDTMFIGEFTFPVAYKGLGTDVAPVLELGCNFTALKRVDTDGDGKNDTYLSNGVYENDFRIAAIILRPKEYDEFLGKEN